MKAQSYAYFGSEEGLFDAIFDASLDRITDVVPIDATDLADWAVRRDLLRACVRRATAPD